MTTRSTILKRIAYLQAELTALAALVDLTEFDAPAPKAAPAKAAPEAAPAPAAPKAAPPAPPAPAPAKKKKPATDPSTWTIGPAEAAEIVGVGRQTVDRRLKNGATDAPCAPANVSQGNARARYRWESESDVRTWWSAVG